MHQLRLAQYAYHNCELTEALRYAQTCGTAEADALHAKILCELDRAPESITIAESLCRRFPTEGLYSYVAGMSHYLAGSDRATVERCFKEAIEKTHPAGHLGMAFIHFAAGDPEKAEHLLSSVTLPDPELSHIRYLMLFQVRNGHDDAKAEEALRAADEILTHSPSLMRYLWGQLCWVRHLRTTAPSNALTLLIRLESLISKTQTPRLARNASVARGLLERQIQSTETLNLPPLSVCPGQIRRKPVLHAMFVFLEGRGTNGSTKEELVEHIWQESYNPLIHDDRIYKTINRLRRALGDNVKEPQILTQVGRQYVLDASRVLGEIHD